MRHASALRDAQQHFARTIAQGPDACPDGLFAGSCEQVLRGLKVHANTISHARLVALEDTYPRTRAAMGEAEFHALSRAYLDEGHGRARSLDDLGEAFPAWLEAADASPDVVALAGFEWCWLSSYHAAEAPGLSAPDLAALDPAAVLALRLGVHPAAQWLPATAGLVAALGLAGTPPDWVLVTRPDAQVLVHGVDEATTALLSIFIQNNNLAAVFETFLAARPNNDVLAAFHHLIAAGSLIKVENPCLP